MDLRDLTAENTQQYVGSTFRLDFGEGRSVDLVLDRVEVLLEKHASKRLTRDSFGMYFAGPKDLYIPQGMYATFHDAMGGPMQIFYVPIRRREDGAYEYEAVFT